MANGYLSKPHCINMDRHEAAANLIANLERERLNLGLTQAKMAEKLCMSLSNYKKIIAGETMKIDFYMAHLIYDLTGKLLFEMCGDTSPEIEIFKKVRKLSPQQMGFVEGIIDFEIEMAEKSEQDMEKIEDEITVLIPTGNLEDGMIWDSANVEKVNVSAYKKKFPDIQCGIRITSNHLHPVYNRGDILLISKRAPRDGDTGIFVNKENGRAYIRRYHQKDMCLLESINDYGETFIVDPNNVSEMAKWIKFGCVVTKIR